MNTKNKWLGLWLNTKATFKNILNKNPNEHIIPLTIFHGILAALIWLVLFWKQSPEANRINFTPGFVVWNILFGIISALIALYVGAWLLKWVGKWFKGKGHYTDLKSALGWTNYPLIVSGIFGLIAALLLWHPIAPIPFDIIKLILLVWAIVMLVKMVAVAHNFSVWKALLVVVISAIIAAIAIFLIGLLSGAISSLFTRT